MALPEAGLRRITSPGRAAKIRALVRLDSGKYSY